MPLRIGEIFADYRVLRLLGSGGMGEVYLVEHPRLPRQEALKVVRPEVSNDPSFRERFVREADLAAGLRHSHIVAVHDRGEHDGHLWIAMDYIAGTDLAELSGQRFPSGMPVDLVVPIVAAVASALDYAHKKGLLHRDVKPANIIVADLETDDPSIFLADFGIARPLDDTGGITRTNMTVGTLAYAAPEQLMGEQINGRADQYALAATAFHLLTGTQLFPHTNPAVVISRHLNTTPPKLADSRADLAELDPALQVALAKEPADRYPSCTNFARALSDGSTTRRAVSSSAPTQEAPQAHKTAPASAGKPSAASMSGTRRTWTVMGSIATIVFIGAVALLWKPWDTRQSNSAETTSITATSTQLKTTSALPPPPPPPPSAPPVSMTPTVTVTTSPPISIVGNRCATAQEFFKEEGGWLLCTPRGDDGSPGTEPIWEPVSGIDMSRVVELGMPCTPDARGSMYRSTDNFLAWCDPYRPVWTIFHP